MRWTVAAEGHLPLFLPEVMTSRARPACFSGKGFTPELRAAERRDEFVLVDLERLCAGQ